MPFLRELAYSRIGGIFESDCPCISHSESVSRLISLLHSAESYEALVTNGDLARIATVRDILRVIHPERSSVSRIAFRPPSVSLDTPIYDVALKMVENRIRILPVMENQSVAGVVRQTKILEKMTDCEDLKEFFSEDLMVKNPVTVYRDSSVGGVRSVMLKRGISHTPVVDQEGKLRGVITAKDIVWNFFKPRERMTVGERKGEKPRIFKMDIRGVIDTHPLHVTPRTLIIDVVREMTSLRKGYCLVVDKHKSVGIITPIDVIKLLIEFKPSIHIPLYVFGFKDEDEAEMELAKRKIERVAVRGLKTHPTLQEIVVHGKTSRVTGNRKRYKIRARAYTPTTRLAFTVKGWSLPNVFDELAQKMDKRLKQTKTKILRFQKKPSRQISPIFNSN